MNSITKIHEIDAYGCHITVEELKLGYFHAVVAYPVYNALGKHIASPEYGKLGAGEDVYLFILAKVANAQKVNKPVIDCEVLGVSALMEIYE